MTTSRFLATAWELNPWVGLACLAALVAYSAAFRLTARLCFLIAGLLVFAVTLVSPVNTLADGYLFSAHMLQHLLLLLVVPALVLLSIPKVVAAAHPRPSDKVLAHPWVGWCCGLCAMWVWHVPALCNAATQLRPVRFVQIVTLLLMGTLFWRPILDPRDGRRLSPLPGVVYLASACLGCTLLGIVVRFSPVEVCSVYLHPVDRLGILPMIRGSWGLTPENDQQLGGLLMWVPACGVYFCGILAMLIQWYRSAEVPPTASRPLSSPAKGI